MELAWARVPPLASELEVLLPMPPVGPPVPRPHELRVPRETQEVHLGPPVGPSMPLQEPTVEPSASQPRELREPRELQMLSVQREPREPREQPVSQLVGPPVPPLSVLLPQESTVRSSMPHQMASEEPAPQP